MNPFTTKKENTATAKIYCLKDTKGGFVNPIKMPNHSIAERAFISSFMTCKDDMMCKFPADYEMWCLGSFNERTGEIIPELELVITGIEALNRANKALKIANKEGDE